MCLSLCSTPAFHLSYKNYSSIVSGQGRNATDDLNLWSNPHDLTHTEADDDEELVALLEKRDNATTAMVTSFCNKQTYKKHKCNF